MTSPVKDRKHRLDTVVRMAALVAWVAAGLSVADCAPPRPDYRTFATPEQATRALIDAATKGSLDELIAILGPEGKELIASSDPATARRNREVFVAAARERLQIIEQNTNGKTIVVGHEEWPFPIPLVKDRDGWHFDTAAGKEEVIARRIGRNELAAIRICQTYVEAQQIYARRGHDGRPPGIFASKFRSDPGRENGLYWPAERGRKRSPLGDLVARATEEGRPVGQESSKPQPLQGYYFKILTAQGADAPGGAKSYLTATGMSGGFALVAWPAQYDVTGVMTFLVSHDGVVREKDLGPATPDAAKAMSTYNPDPSWKTVR